jgi:bifunctional non-homologous end joining protein LigD
MSLVKYRQKRDFAKTQEPSGKARRKTGNSYVIQKHDASHLHYDFRLELDGVLLSWAVPKGPTFDPSVKRLAVQTEDHPLEYGGFEGSIPEGEYGGGTVMVWDRGTWEPDGDAREAYKKGHLSFQLHGEKLTGGWHLVKTQRPGQKQNTWLLFKAKDEAAKPGDTSLLEESAKSVLTGRDLKAIADGVPGEARKASKATKASKKAKATQRVATSQPVAASRATKATKPSKAGKASKGSELVIATKSTKAESGKAAQTKANAKQAARAVEKTAMPERIEPELATLVSAIPESDDFIHEVKFDGYRVLAHLNAGEVRLLTRGGEDWTARMESLARAVRKLKATSAILDGEFVALDEHGLTDFQLLQNAFSGKSRAQLAYYAFDLLYLDGEDLRDLPLLERKERLQDLLVRLPKTETTLRYSDHTRGNGAGFFAEAVKLGLEGVVSKRAQSPYRSGRGKDWQKSKSLARQEFVIVGFTEPAGGRSHLGALLLGVVRDEQVVYAGRVGTGFSERSLKDLHTRLQPLEIDNPSLINAPRGAEVRGVHWVEPQLVAEVAYTAMTHDGLLRHPTFKGLREDKPAREVVLEQPHAVASRAVRKHEKPAAASKVALSHPDKVLYPELGLTKRELADYYELVSEVMLPHVVNRPLTLLRCPEGRNKQCFFQKHPGESLAEGLVRVQVPSSDGTSEYAAIADARGLPALVQMGVLEAHIWGALASNAEHPDRLVFDLDPAPELDFAATVGGAHALRQLLEELGLKSWVKTTGGKGLHVTVPIVPQAGWDEIKNFCRAVAEELTRRDPERYLATMSKAKRKGKIFIDYLRNGRGATFIAPYSPRAREGATIAMPVEWDDLTARFKPESFNVRSAAKYLNQRSADPFATLLKARQKLPSASKAERLGKR